MKITNKKSYKIIIAMCILCMSLCLVSMTGCGDKSSKASGDLSSVDVSELSGDPEALAQKAEELNKDAENFYGKWEATSENAENLYGFLEISINEDGTVVMDMAEEHLEGTWEKVDGGIHFENELFDGDFYYGKKCRMVIKEIEEDDEIKVTLTKVE